jgi:hypothetical protein
LWYDDKYNIKNGGICVREHNYDEFELENADKSYFLGTLGAIAGAVIGAVPWAIVYSFGWFVGWLGLIIGFCAAKGYDICRGKQKKVKALIVVFAIIVGVAAGQIMGDFIDLGKEIARDEYGYFEMLGITYADIPGIYFNYVAHHTDEFLSDSIFNLLLGLLFAGLGSWALVKDIIKPPPVVITETCAGCGAELAESTAFCASCGARTGPEDEYGAAQEQECESEPEYEPEHETADL